MGKVSTLGRKFLKTLNLKYNELTGEFTRKVNKYRPDAPTTTKGYKGPGSYLYIKIKGKRYSSHSLALLLSGVEIPAGSEVDHIDGDRQNNTLKNLRIVSRQENMENKRLYSSNKSGFPGVTWSEKEGKWKARINIKGVRVHLGTFENIKDAIEVRQKAEKHSGYHKNHGEFCGYPSSRGY